MRVSDNSSAIRLQIECFTLQICTIRPTIDLN